MSTDCQTCKPEPQRPYVGIGTPIEMPGVRHRADCPLVPHLSPEAASHYATMGKDFEILRQRVELLEKKLQSLTHKN